jgi:hypothetical protein
MEEVAKAIWYDTPKPLRQVKAINRNKCYLKVTRPYLMRDGSKERGEVQVHPDPRVQAVLATARENELIQAIDRARLIWGEPKDVYILCDIPLPGVEIDRLVSWDVLRGAEELSQALAAQTARGKRALPLTPRWLAKHFPEKWKTEKAAERWLEYSPEITDLRKNPQLANKTLLLGKWGFFENAPENNGLEGSPPFTGSRSGEINLIEYRLPGQKRWSSALVWHEAPGAALAQVLGAAEVGLSWRPLAIGGANPSGKRAA